MSGKATIGIIGMGVMGKSLALNLARKNIFVSVYNRHVPGKEENIASGFAEAQNLPQLQGFDNLDDFIASLEKPRKILFMITAGRPVDQLLKGIIAYLRRGDILMDGGNSFYKDTAKREKRLWKSKVHYLGVGISGGEEGALKGPSLMPGGNKKGFDQVKDILKLAAAKDRQGQPCVSYIGSGGAGHFVKMVHNGIEYAEMQLLAENYDLLKRGYGFKNNEIAGYFKKAAKEGAGGFLTEATIDILNFKEKGEYVLDKILDRSGQKGTGGWTVETALQYGMPLSTITEAVMARLISSKKEKRMLLSEIYNDQINSLSYSEVAEKQLIQALIAARLINHLIGFDFIRSVADENKWEISLSEIARIWTNGCIIRSDLMEELVKILNESEDGWSNENVINRLIPGRKALAQTISNGVSNNVSMPVMTAALNHLNGLTTAYSSANLIQAHRDYFGAHTFQRIDKPGDEYFHINWLSQ